MFKKKEVADALTKSLISNDNIASIMLKAQMLASLLGNDEFSKWVHYEQNGYPNGATIPEYRRIGCSVKAHISLRNGSMWQNMSIPPDSIEDEKINNRVFTVALGESITALDAFSSIGESNNQLVVELPVYVFPYLDNVFEGHSHRIIKAWQIFPKQAAKSIVEKIKSALLDFILQLDKSLNLEIDFTIEDQSKVEKIMNTTITANMVHTGNGNITVNDGNFIVGNNVQNIMTENTKEDILKLIDKLQELKNQVEIDEIEFTDYLDEIQNELNKKVSSPKIIRKSLRALKSLGGIITEKAIEFGIDKIITSIPLT